MDNLAVSRPGRNLHTDGMETDVNQVREMPRTRSREFVSHDHLLNIGVKHYLWHTWRD